jgi:hypothetical protein
MNCRSDTIPKLAIAASSLEVEAVSPEKAVPPDFEAVSPEDEAGPQEVEAVIAGSVS